MKLSSSKMNSSFSEARNAGEVCPDSPPPSQLVFDPLRCAHRCQCDGRYDVRG